MKISSTRLHTAIIAAVAVLGFAYSFGATPVAATPTTFPVCTSCAAFAESWSSCTSNLCIDAAPGPKGQDGSGGWGWNDACNAPVTTLTVGVPAPFTVTMLQPGNAPFCNGGNTASITLTYSSQDFTLNPTSGRGAVASTPFDRGGAATFSYTDAAFLCHTNPSDQSDGFTFTPQNPTGTALVTATITVIGPDGLTVVQQASSTFPVAIVAAPKKGKK